MLYQVVVSGITAGSIYALVALAFVLIYKGTRVMNFGQGEQLMLGAYLVVVMQTFLHVQFLVGVLVALVLSAGFGILIQVLIMKRIEASSPLTKIISTLAFGLILKEGTRTIIGSNPLVFPFLLSPAPIGIAGVLVTPANLAVVAVSFAVMGVFYVFFRYVRFGKALRAACENRVAASLMGISVPFVFCSIWAIGSTLAAISGILIAPLVTLTPDIGLVAINGWVAAVVGGFTSLPGAVIGGMTIGVIETLAGTYISTALKDGITYLLLIVVLFIRPSGLLERKMVKKV